MKPNVTNSIRYFLSISSDRHAWPMLAKSFHDVANDITRSYKHREFNLIENSINEISQEKISLIFKYSEEAYICWIIKEADNLSVESKDYDLTVSEAQDIKNKLRAEDSLP